MNMKYVVLAVSFIVFVCATAHAQIAKIVNVEGSVSIKPTATSNWQKAKPQMYIKQEAEIKTGPASQCIIAFDENLANIATIDENTQVKLQDLKPAKISLPRGRIFILIDDEVSLLMPFEVRTPTAIAGVRGTGESVEFKAGETTVQCFEGKVYVHSLDTEGFRRQTRTLLEGNGIKIVSHGRMRNPFKVSISAYETWYDHKMKMKEFQKTRRSSAPGTSITIQGKGQSGQLLLPTYETVPSYNIDALKKRK